MGSPRKTATCQRCRPPLHRWPRLEHGYHGDTRLVHACVRRLRNKNEDNPGPPRCVQKLRGFGYRLGAL